MSWTAEDIPDLEGKVSIVTGANSGIGFATTKLLAENGSKVVMACRNERKAKRAKEQIEAKDDTAELDVMVVDLANRSQIKVFSSNFEEKYERLDIMINNAGVMHTEFKRTDFGFEYQFGVNFLGHFLLNSELVDLIKETGGSRVVSVSSLLHRDAEMNFDKLNSEEEYDRKRAYADSKMAMILYASELQRRFEREEIDSKSVPVHPGFVDTPLHDKAASNMEGKIYPLAYRGAARTMAQSPEKGALPSLYAATAEGVEGGEFIGPGGFREMRGNPTEVEPDGRAEDEELASKLWEYAEKQVETEFNL